LAEDDEQVKIIKRMQKLSQEFGTIVDDNGVVKMSTIH